MRESVANKMLRAEDYQKIRTLHQLYLFVSSTLFSFENEKSESEERLSAWFKHCLSTLLFLPDCFPLSKNSETGT